ncbi:hypothetical protein BJ322DRAFT_1033950 [Thelephora terrestris]|uniref:Uncharacterized protein n=1 Tax=Thelephora terrestris TaxID=56493 RepID=A0A9P6HS40_9AGAM|nr:hypothetical protein BJ322DRAFT_1033950 [Thelephora terrestris]
MNLTNVVDVNRPGMRRKSSAQNLLSSFKNSTAQIQANMGSNSATPSPNMPPATPTAVFSPVTQVSYNKEWDSQSIISDPLPPLPVVQGQFINGVDYIRDLVQKRIVTMTYLRNVHEGRSHWFHTVVMTRADIERLFPNHAMRKRTYRFTVLGMSLSSMFEVKDTFDLLRGLLNILSEYEQIKDDPIDKSKIRIFRTKPNKRQGLGEYAMSYSDTSETTYLITPPMPFQLDYQQTVISLFDVLSEIYNKILKYLGPSPGGQQMYGPLGLLSPHPGVSYLFTGAEPYVHTPLESESSLWGIANANNTAGSMGSPPPNWTSAYGEMVLKVDSKFRKIVGVLLKELDEYARSSMRDELASLDPLLRSAGLGHAGHDLDGAA